MDAAGSAAVSGLFGVKPDAAAKANDPAAKAPDDKAAEAAPPDKVADAPIAEPKPAVVAEVRRRRKSHPLRHRSLI